MVLWDPVVEQRAEHGGGEAAERSLPQLVGEEDGDAVVLREHLCHRGLALARHRGRGALDAADEDDLEVERAEEVATALHVCGK